MTTKEQVRDELLRQLFAADRATKLEKQVAGKIIEKAYEQVAEKKRKAQIALAGLIVRCESCNAKSSQTVVKETRMGRLCRSCAQEQGALPDFMEQAFQPIKEPTEKPQAFGEWS